MPDHLARETGKTTTPGRAFTGWAAGPEPGPCDATLLLDGGAWHVCGDPGIARHRYACVHEHVAEGWTCEAHAPELGSAGCRRCADAGHLCGMAAQVVPGE